MTGGRSAPRAEPTRPVRRFPSSQAIEADGTNHVYYSNRSAAYLSMDDGEKALADADACIAANPSWPKGYGRKGAALHHLGRIDESVAAYDEGLKADPGNAALTSGRESAARAQMANPFSDIVAWAATDPRFREHMADPSFVSKLTMLSTNPNAMSSAASDPRVLEVIGAKLGIDLGAMGGAGAGGPPPAPSAAETAAARAAAQAEAEEAAREAEEAARAEAEAGMTEEEKAEMEEMRQAAAARAELRAKADAAKAEGNGLYKKRDFGEPRAARGGDCLCRGQRRPLRRAHANPPPKKLSNLSRPSQPVPSPGSRRPSPSSPRS